jgi:hypothetical protein
LSYHPSEAKEGEILRNKLWDVWEEYSGYVFGFALVILAVLINRLVRPYWSTHFIDDLIVALMIAGILTATVDPFVKRTARREATRDIFHHMLGYSLPVVIRERLQNTVEKTKIYRQNLTEHIVISEDGESLVFDTEVEFEVINPTPHDLDFLPLLQFEKSEQPALKSLTCFGEPNCGKGAKLGLTANGMGFECRGAEVKIPSGASKRFKYEYSVRYPTALGFYYPNFQYPTIGLALTIKAPSNLRVTATPAEHEAEGEWRYANQLFMPGERVGIVWEKVN